VAVSYCWGSLDNPLTTQVNETPFKVTRHVVSILNFLAAPPLPDRPGSEYMSANRVKGQPMWIDSISINQQDTQERTAQIKMMKNIYETATMTMIYLGQPTSRNEHARLAFEWLFSITEDSFEQFLTTPKETRLLRWNSQKWAHVVELLEESRWFRRRWIVQEAAVSRHALVVYGTRALRWDCFADAIERCAYMFGDIVNRPGFQMELSEPRADPIPTLSIAKLRMHLRNGSPPPRLFDTLIRFRRCGCMYAGERIFTLLGLCSDAEQSLNEIDLTLGPVEVFKRFVVYHIQLLQRPRCALRLPRNCTSGTESRPLLR
jgi:Heterokaryon incompatibility protein (HET)